MHPERPVVGDVCRRGALQMVVKYLVSTNV